MSETLLEGTAEGERLTLSGSGAWTAPHARALEALIDAQAKQHGTIRQVDIDMAKVEHLDTFGAWLLERLVRDFTNRGCDTRMVGLKDDYRALMDELHGVKEAPPHRRGQSLVYAVASIGREHRFRSAASFVAILNMLGALSVVILRVRWRGRAASVSPRWCISSTTSPGARCRSSC